VTVGSNANFANTTAIQGGNGTSAITLTPQTTGAIVIGASAGTGAITLGSSSAAQTVNVGTGAGASTVNIANGLAGNTIALGNGANTSAQTINIGAGANAANNTINIGSGTNTAGVIAVKIGSNANLANTTTIQGGNGTGAITLTPQTAGTIIVGATAGTGAITVGSSSAAQTVNVGTGAGVSTVNIATGAGGNTVSIGGTGTTNGNGVRLGNGRITNAKPTLAVSAAASITPSVTQVLDASIFLLTGNTNKTITMPSAQGATGLVQALPSATVGDVFKFLISYTGTGNITLVAGTGVTISGPAAVTGPISRVVYCQVTSVTSGSETISCY